MSFYKVLHLCFSFFRFDSILWSWKSKQGDDLNIHQARAAGEGPSRPSNKGSLRTQVVGMTSLPDSFIFGKISKLQGKNIRISKQKLEEETLLVNISLQDKCLSMLFQWQTNKNRLAGEIVAEEPQTFPLPTPMIFYQGTTT